MPNGTDFVIEDGVLRKYTGPGGDVAIPRGVTAIRHHAFACCDRLTGIAIPEGVTEIGEGAFGFCTALTDVTIPGSVKRIGRAVFFGCDAIRRVTIENGAEEIGDRAFWGCKRLVRASLPESIVRIGAQAFCDCWKLPQIALPDRVARIDRRTFEDCWELKTVTLPGCIEAIDEEAFRSCYSLKRVRIPAGTARIGRGAFAGCAGLSGVELPAGLTQIDAGAFYNCSALTGLSLPEGLTAIGDGAFRKCESLTDVTIPESVAKIGRGAFDDCTGLTAATVTDAVIDFGVFSGCRSLEAFVVSPASGRYSAMDGVVFSKNGHRLIAYPPGRSRDRYDIPETVTEVADNAFAGAPVGLVFVHSGVACFPETAEGDPYVASSNAAFISRLGRPVYLGPPEELSNKNRRRAVEGFLFALEAGTPEIEPWREDYIDCIRREYVTWEKRAWRSGTLLRLMIDRRMLRPETAENMRRKYVSSGREDMALLLSDYIASAGG